MSEGCNSTTPTPTVDGTKWRELQHKLQPFVKRRVSSGADVDDVMQEIFVRMQRGLGSLRDEERLDRWVFQIARNAIVDHQRRASRQPIATEPEVVEALADEPLFEREREREQEQHNVERDLAAYVAVFVSMLPSPYREALTLTELQGLTQKEAAQMLGVSLTAMKSRVQRGRQQLRAALEDCCKIALDARGQVLQCEPRPHGSLGTRCECG